ncbi:NUDIX hydrolase [Paenibacillus sp. HB172176]|uniref:NUDIX hydrolase n=1 Tax=Paenibacillus sp. HB172176 TaxID=2493690 RepID=UPI00143C8A3F|nr:NUDIX hydrolase [Paenibacillus sp. HB172176]
MTVLNHAEFPALTGQIDWGTVKSKFRLSTAFDELLVSNISIIPCVLDKYVIFQIEDGRWELPGGTLEPGEPYMDGLKRELMEELGGVLLSYELFGYFACESKLEKPYRPHIPHPSFIRLIGWGEVSLVRPPLNPPDGEQVIAVETVTVDEAVNKFMSQGRSDIAEMYKLAHHIRCGADT